MRRAVWAKSAAITAVLLLGAATAQAERKPAVSPAQPGDLRPAIRIEVAPLGYMPPSAFYLTYRMSSAAIGFFDDEHLLFTFRIGGLLKRSPEDRTGDDDQEIRALVLDLKTGKATKQTEWRMHDREAYLWPYTDGRFMVRIRDSLFLTNQSLQLEPYLTFPEELREVEVSPDRKLTVLEVDEPEKPHTAISLLGPEEAAQPVKITILPSGSRSAAAASDARQSVLLPLVEDGVLDTLEGTKQASWVMREVPFHGQPRTIAEIRSTCRPAAQPVSGQVVLMLGCYLDGDDREVVALSTDGRELWQTRWQNRYVWGWFDFAENGSRFAYESLEVARPVNTFDALDPGDITAQLAGVYDTRTGKLVLVKNASPVLSAGQNVALSPDGKRFAILREGALEVYDLPPVSEPVPPKPKASGVRR